MINSWLLSVIGFLGLAACSLESSADRATKSGLLGSWIYEFKDESERNVKVVVSLGFDGTFVERNHSAGDGPEEFAKGVWRVTDSLLKVESTERNGVKLGTLGDRYRTCAVSGLTSESFNCSFGSSGRMVHYIKVHQDHPLL